MGKNKRYRLTVSAVKTAEKTETRKNQRVGCFASDAMDPLSNELYCSTIILPHQHVLLNIKIMLNDYDLK